MLAFGVKGGFLPAVLTLRTSHTLIVHNQHTVRTARSLFTSSLLRAKAPAASNAASSDPPLRCVVFDMDGTLTKEGSLDFNEMYRRAGKPAHEKNILAWVETLPPAEKMKAEQAIKDVEREGFKRQELAENCASMLDQLRQRPVKLAILTRNSDEGIDIFFEMFGLRNHFDATFSREWKGGRSKPHPDALLHLAEKWGLAPREIMMVGDWKDDIEAGLAAGARTCLKRNPHSTQRDNSGITNAEHDVQDLLEVVPLVDRLI